MILLAPPDFNTYFYLILAAATLVLSAGRLTRVLVAEDYPPSIKVRMWWDKVTKDGPWSKLVHCPWCMGPWITLVLMVWAVLSNLHWTWWLFNGWMALSYATSWVVFHDEDGGPAE